MVIYNSKLLNPDLRPRNLQKKVQFDVRYYLCRRGSENIYEMKTDMFTLGFNSETKIAYVYKQKDELQKNHKEMPTQLSLDSCLKSLMRLRDQITFVL